MIPIYLLKEAGVNYSWDSKNKTVNIINNVNSIPTITNQNVDVERLKSIVEVADFYKRLDALGSAIAGLRDSLSLVFYGVNLGYDSKPDYSLLNEYINLYNDFTKDIVNLKNSVGIHGISLEKADEVLKNYYDSIDYFKLSYGGMDRYVISKIE